VARLRLDPPNPREAEYDLTAALDRGVSALQVYTLRSQVRAQLNDPTGAAQDRKAASEYRPRTEGDFLTRGRSRLPADPKGALADFEAAARLNPTSLNALQNQAHVLSEYLRDAPRALKVVTRAAELYPHYAPARGGRAVLLARAGKRDDAHLEAEIALRESDDPSITYQVAGVYALTSATHAADADRALTLLRQAVRDGFRDVRTLDDDADLTPLRTRPEFTTLVTNLKALPR
jgi:tetratricopeptide (TPR) repeat protein